jgi:hypothetical protein
MFFPLLLVTNDAHALPGPDVVFAPLDDKPVPVECAASAPGGPWCRSFGVIEAPVERVAAALEDMKGNAHLFESIVSIQVLAPDTMHVVMDYPAPFADRDYVAKYTRTVDGASRRYRWDPVVHAGAPVTDSPVRLPRFAGEWRLEPHPRGTKVTYLWHAEVAGSFPGWAYETAWRKAGYEALKDLANTRSAVLSAP